MQTIFGSFAKYFVCIFELRNTRAKAMATSSVFHLGFLAKKDHSKSTRSQNSGRSRVVSILDRMKNTRQR